MKIKEIKALLEESIKANDPFILDRDNSKKLYAYLFRLETTVNSLDKMIKEIHRNINEKKDSSR